MDYDVSLLTENDIYLFNQGTHYRLYEKLGAHPLNVERRAGVYFAVWAPDAERVSVIGDFNGWNKGAHVLRPKGSSGIWEGFLVGCDAGTAYKYHVASRYQGYRADKADPFAFAGETPPRTASVVHPLEFSWGDQAWMARRQRHNALDAPQSIYEVHLGSWRRVPNEGCRSLSYRELAPLLADYVTRMGFTHVEFLQVMENTFYGNWG